MSARQSVRTRLRRYYEGNLATSRALAPWASPQYVDGLRELEAHPRGPLTKRMRRDAVSFGILNAVGGSVVKRNDPRIIDRLLARVDSSDPDACWEWQGATGGQGYGQIRFRGQLHYTHRVTYVHYVGPIPAGLELDHLCRNRACCNPRHLEAVTHRENGMRGISPTALAAKQTHCIHGHAFSPENTYVRKDTGARMCRECKRVRDRAREVAA